MPYRWTDDVAPKSLRLWPHQSMTPSGFTWFVGSTAALFTLPLLAVLGSPIAWVLMAFFLCAIAGIWRAIMANRAHLSFHEELVLTSDMLKVEHVPSKGPSLVWQANPHWVSVNLRHDGPVEKYLTLRGSGREVELGAFLTPDERESLYAELQEVLAQHPPRQILT